MGEDADDRRGSVNANGVAGLTPMGRSRNRESAKTRKKSGTLIIPDEGCCRWRKWPPHVAGSRRRAGLASVSYEYACLDSARETSYVARDPGLAKRIELSDAGDFLACLLCSNLVTVTFFFPRACPAAASTAVRYCLLPNQGIHWAFSRHKPSHKLPATPRSASNTMTRRKKLILGVLVVGTLAGALVIALLYFAYPLLEANYQRNMDPVRKNHAPYGSSPIRPGASPSKSTQRKSHSW